MASGFVPLVIALVFVGVVVSQEGRVSYEGYAVYRVYPTSVDQVKYLQELENNDNLELDFWIRPGKTDFVDVSVKPALKFDLQVAFKDRGIYYETMIEDLESLIAETNSTYEDQYSAFDANPRTFHLNYHRLDGIHNFVKNLGNRYAGLSVSTLNLGKSTEGRDILGLKISAGNAKKSIFIEGGAHAREWISPATILYITEQFLENYGSDAKVTNILNTFDLYIVPVSNPDGYEYSHVSNRMWRKTRSSGGFCKGTDPNRNWDFKWRTGGSSTNACSDTYAGPSAFSEPETRNIGNFILPRKNEFIAYLSIHSYSQLILTPWGYTSTLPSNYKELERVAQIAVKALTAVHGTQYRIGSTTAILYVASGGSADWALGAAGIPYSYTYELRDTGRYGFNLPKEQIVPSGQETFASFVALFNELINKV